jgi:hypothetical protein
MFVLPVKERDVSSHPCLFKGFDNRKRFHTWCHQSPGEAVEKPSETSMEEQIERWLVFRDLRRRDQSGKDHPLLASIDERLEFGRKA